MIESNRQNGVSTKSQAIRLAMFVAGYAILGSALVPSMMRWMDAHEIPPLIEDLIMCSVFMLVVVVVTFCYLRSKICSPHVGCYE